MLPVGSGEIANILAEDSYGLGAVSLGLRIKNEFGLAGRGESGVPGGRRSRLGTLVHRREGRSSGTPRPLASMTQSLGGSRPTVPKNAFAWDCNQARICDELQSQPCEDFLVRERALGGHPEASNMAQDGSTEKPQEGNQGQELLKLRGKMPQSQVAAGFPSQTLKRERARCLAISTS